jgi:hypothetical protein
VAKFGIADSAVLLTRKRTAGHRPQALAVEMAGVLRSVCSTTQ